MPREIERKYLFNGKLSLDTNIVKRIDIEQGYISLPDDSLVLRVRRSVTQCTNYTRADGYLTIKRRDGGPGLFEREIDIEPDLAKEMLTNECKSNIITKRRTVIEFGPRLKAEIDTFKDQLAPIEWVEIEVPTEHYVFDLPAFCGKEITNAKGLSNFDMAWDPEKTKAIFNGL